MKYTPPTPPERKFVIICGVAVGLWLAFALAIAPWLIRSAYAESSLPFLNNMLEGRSIHPVERYLGAWWGVATKATAAIALIGILGLLGVRHRAQVRSAFEDRHWQRTSPSAALLTAAWLGWWAGLIDISYRLLEVAVRQRPKGAGIEDLWMAPILGAVITGGLGWLVWTVMRRVKGDATLHPAVTVGAGFLFYSWLRLFGLGIHPAASLVLALGLASQLVRPLVTWGDGFSRLARRTFPWMAAATVATAVSMGLAESLSERRALAGLEPARAGATSVLLLILDTARAKSMSLYGAERRTTPNIDRLAERGTVFERAIAPTPWTLPSHATFFTGLLPNQHQAGWSTRLDEDFTTLAEVMADRGFATGGFAANLEYTVRATGLDQGFHRYSDDSLSPGRFLGSLAFVRAPVLTLRRWLGNRRSLVRKNASDVNEEFLDWLDGSVEEDRPFFGFLNYFDVHSGYEQQSPFDTLFSPPGGLHWIEGSWVNASRYSDSELAELETAYDEAMAYLDHQIGLLVEELEARGRLDNTLVIVTSDHGEQFGEHDLLGHSNSLYMPLLHVPMVLVHPGAGVPVGVRIDTPVALSDLAATVLDLAGAPPELPGESLARYWREGPGVAPIPTQVDDGFDRWSMRGVLDGNWNYIRNYGGDVPEELYDLKNDPDELDNKSAGPMDHELMRRRERMRSLADSLHPGPEPWPELPMGCPPARITPARACPAAQR